MEWDTEHLGEKQAWLEATLRSIQDAVIATDAQGRIRFLNREAARLTGWSEAEALGRLHSEVVTILGAQDEFLINRDGYQIPIEHRSAPIVHDTRGRLGVVLTFKEATPASATEERLRLAVAGAEMGMWDLDLATDRAIWNPTMYAILGIDFSTPLTREVRRAHVHPDDAQLVLDTMAAARAERRSFGVEYRAIRHSDRSLRWLSVRGKYIYDENGEVTRVIGVVIDITERRNLEARVRQAQRLDALGTLAGGIAHDFNNILAVLRGSLEALKEEVPAEGGAAALLAHMTQACSRATDLVRQILAFARQQEQDRRVVHLKPVLQDALQLLRSTLPRTLAIDVQIPDDLPTILADVGQLNQVIMNLGINAAQAMEDQRGQIQVSVEVYPLLPGDTQLARELQPGRYLRVRFSDTGRGMTREVAERVFEPFFTTKPQGRGTGLGLSVVQGIMKNHEGTITVYSEVGRGTRFHLYFPVMEDVVPQAASPTLEMPAGQGERILYVDDEEALVSLTTRLLQRMGYQAAGFTDAQEALAAFAAAPQAFDLVVTDMAMPGMTGIDLAQQVLAIRPDIPVLLASGYVRPEEAERAREAGIRKVIWKPSTLSEMGVILREELARAMRPTGETPP